MRAENKEIIDLRMEYPNCDWNRKNQIFESLSYIASNVGKKIYIKIKSKFGDVCNYDECMMTAFEKLHKILLLGNTKTDLYDSVYKACYKHIEKLSSRLSQEKEYINNQSSDVVVFSDEENWDDITEGGKIWNLLAEYDTNQKRKEALSLYFGFDGNNPHKQVEIAKMLKTSHVRIRRFVCRHGLDEAQRVAICNKQKLTVLKLAKTGQYSMNRIAQKTGLKLSQVNTIIKKYSNENE